jgi:hypothetical protein
VHGTPTISHTAGTCASRDRDPRPSAMLNTMSTRCATIPSMNRLPPPSRTTR